MSAHLAKSRLLQLFDRVLQRTSQSASRAWGLTALKAASVAVVVVLAVVVLPFGWGTALLAVVVGVAFAAQEVWRRRDELAGTGTTSGQRASATCGSTTMVGAQVQVLPSSGPTSRDSEIPAWVKELYNLLCKAFTADELRRIVRYETNLREPRGAPAAIHDVADDVASAAHRSGVHNGFFDALVEVNKSRTRDIEAVRRAWRASQGQGGAPRYGQVVLDRVLQWDKLLQECADSDDNLIIIVHGDHEQDVDLFLMRMKQHLPKQMRTRREHDYYEVKRTIEHTAITGKDWAQRVTGSTMLGGRLCDALRHCTREQAAVFVFQDYNHPLRGLDKQAFDGLIALFTEEIGPTIANLRHHHPLRFVVPFQHSTDGKTIRRRIKKAAKELADVPGIRLVELDELTLPDLDEVLAQIKRDFPALYDDLRPRINDLWAEFSDVDRTPEQSIRVLGGRLQEILDKALATQRKAH